MSLEPYQVLFQFYGELGRADGEAPSPFYLKYLFPCLILLLSEMCSQLFLSLVYPIENNFIQSVSNKELHVIFAQLGITALVSFQKHDEIALTYNVLEN